MKNPLCYFTSKTTIQYTRQLYSKGQEPPRYIVATPQAANALPAPGTPTSDDGVDALIQQRHGWGAAEGKTTTIRKKTCKMLISLK